MPQETDRYELHSEEIQDIIGRAPSWVVRRGTIVVTVLVVVLLVGAWFIKYPDIVTAQVYISANTPPVKLVARANGRIAEMHGKDGMKVLKDDIIAVIDNPARTADVLKLRDVVENIDTVINIDQAISHVAFPVNMQVGDMQANYASLVQAINNYNFFAGNQYYKTRDQMLKTQLQNLAMVKQGIVQREKYQKEQLQIDHWRDSVNQILLKDRVISIEEYNNIKKQYLNQRMSNNDNLNSIIQSDQQQKEYQKSLSDVNQQYKKEERDALFAIKDAVKIIKGQIATWESTYVLRAPVEGKLTFFRVWKENQFVTNGEPVFTITPETQQYITRAQLPVFKAGKVKQGQRVLLKLREYPYEEFGMLRASVEGLTNVALDSVYSVQVKLDNGFQTTRNKTIPLRPLITGTADIITNDKNILQRLFENMYGKLNER